MQIASMSTALRCHDEAPTAVGLFASLRRVRFAWLAAYGQQGRLHLGESRTPDRDARANRKSNRGHPRAVVNFELAVRAPWPATLIGSNRLLAVSIRTALPKIGAS